MSADRRPLVCVECGQIFEHEHQGNCTQLRSKTKGFCRGKLIPYDRRAAPDALVEALKAVRLATEEAEKHLEAVHLILDAALRPESEGGTT